jgi:adenylate cyclase, class 2
MRFARGHYTSAMSLSGKAVARTAARHLRKTPGTEVEVKLPMPDRKAFLRLLKKLKASGGARMHEMNTLYDTPAGTLARAGKLVRIRILTIDRGAGKPARKAGRRAHQETVVLTYKGPAQPDDAADGSRYKVREERELRVEDSEALAQVFEGMGLRPRFRYEKYRTTYRLQRISGLLVELDETPIGDFLELEGDSAAIDRGAAILGYGPADYITKSYGQLFQEQRQRLIGKACSPLGGTLPATDCADMLFPRQK